MRRPRTSRRRRDLARARSASRSVPPTSATATALRGEAALRALIADEHLVPQVLPDLRVDLDEAGMEPHFGDVPRAREIDPVFALDRSRSRGDHDHAVGEGDGLLEVVRD